MPVTDSDVGEIATNAVAAIGIDEHVINIYLCLVAPWQGEGRLKKNEKRKILSELALTCWQDQLSELGW